MRGHYSFQNDAQPLFSNSTFILLMVKYYIRERSGGAMVPGKLLVSGSRTNLDYIMARPNGLTVGAGGICKDLFSLVYHFSLLSPSFWDIARYKFKYCLKGPLSTKQPTNKISYIFQRNRFIQVIGRKAFNLTFRSDGISNGQTDKRENSLILPQTQFAWKWI